MNHCTTWCIMEIITISESKEDVERFIVVDVKYSQTLARPVGLDEIKADPRFAGWDLLRISRLSIVPVRTTQHLF